MDTETERQRQIEIAKAKAKAKLSTSRSAGGSIMKDEYNAGQEKIPAAEMVGRSIRRGALPFVGSRISAAVRARLEGVPYDEALATEQLRDQETDNQYSTLTRKAIEVPTSIAATAGLSEAPWLVRLATSGGLGGMTAADSQDMSTKEGWKETAKGAAVGLGVGGAAEGVSALSKPGMASVEDLASRTTKPSEILADTIPIAKREGVKETIQAQPQAILDMAQEGSENVSNRLGEAIEPYRTEAFKKTTDKVSTPRVVQMLDEMNPPISKSTTFSSSSSSVPEGEDTFLNGIKSRVQTSKSTADTLSIVDDLDDEATRYYNMVTANKSGKLSRGDREYYGGLINLRNELKNSLRTSESPWGQADSAFHEFSSNQKPTVEAVERAKLAFDAKSRKLPDLGPEQGKMPFPTKWGALHKVMNKLKVGPEYADEFTKNWQQGKLDPLDLMKLVAAGDEEISPNVKPSMLLNVLSKGGSIARFLAPAGAEQGAKEVTNPREDLYNYLQRKK